MSKPESGRNLSAILSQRNGDLWMGRKLAAIGGKKCIAAISCQRGTAEQYIKEGKNAVKWIQLSCRTIRGNAVRLQLHALAYNLANFLRTLALPQEVQHWSLTSIRDKLVKIGTKLVSHARYAVFQMAEVAVPRDLFRHILTKIADLRRQAPTPY
jgi:hypothetical protein